MANPRRETRRLAMQVLYQIDVTGETDAEAIRAGLDTEHDSEDVCDEAIALALPAWEAHADADAAIGRLTPEWPTHRQPPVDRAILRLGYHEMATGHAPPKVVINECVELAKQYAGEKSPPFINGVLDKLAKQLAPAPGSSPGSGPGSAPPTPNPNPATWLKDAIGD